MNKILDDLKYPKFRHIRECVGTRNLKPIDPFLQSIRRTARQHAASEVVANARHVSDLKRALGAGFLA